MLHAVRRQGPFPKIRDHDVLARANAAGDGLTDRSRAYQHDNLIHDSFLTSPLGHAYVSTGDPPYS
jgi:hypothetical protein